MQDNVFHRLIGFLRSHSLVTSITVVSIVVAVAYIIVIGLKPILVIVPDKITIEQGKNIKLRALYDQDGRFNFRKPIDVTAKATWTSGDENIFLIGMHPKNIGEISARQAGTMAVTVKYLDIESKAIVNVKASGLVAICKAVNLKTNKIYLGQPVEFLAYYTKTGVPDYKYVWTASEDQTSTEISPIFFFTRPGVKNVKSTITDNAGTVIDIECEPLEVLLEWYK